MAGTGTAGSSLTQLYYPWGIYLDGSNSIYIADYYNHRVQKYMAGKFCSTLYKFVGGKKNYFQEILPVKL